MFPRFAWFVLGVALVAPACGAEFDGRGEDATVDRHPLGKADAIGSCASDDGGNVCGGQSSGNCWCDDACEENGDCCADKVSVCDDLELSVPSIDSAAMFDAMAFSGDGGMIIGKSVKFVIDNRTDQAEIHFLNANYAGPVSNPDATKLHYFFAHETLGITESTSQFNDVTYWTNDKRYFAGTLQEYRLGADAEPLYAIQFYPQDVLAEQTVVTAVRAVASTVNIPASRLAFVATGPQQTTETVGTAIADLGAENLTIDQVLGALDYIPMQTGEAWGFLRIFPEDHDTLSAVDIPVFAELPLDLTVVAGSITRQVQDASSHINLKSKERGTPNMVLRSAGPEHHTLAEFADRPVHLVVGAAGFSIEPSTEAEVREKLAEKLNKPWTSLEVDPAAVITSYDDMCPGAASDCLGLAASFGGKAGNLGFLRHREVLGIATDPGSTSHALGYDVAPAGVGVPVRHYFELVEHNPDLAETLDAFVAEEREGTLSVAERVAALADIRELFLDAQMPPGFVDAVVASVTSVLPPETESLKIRSSANAEDIPGFDGAGLYDSFRADLAAIGSGDSHCALRFDDDGDLHVEPRTVECAIKGTYASLWNKRAVEERSFARIDHASAGMGLTIVRRYKEKEKIVANSVVVTRVFNSSGVFGYTFSSQVKNNVVTNPAPGTESESIIAAFLPGVDPSFVVTRFAQPKPDEPRRTTPVMSQEAMNTMLRISQDVENAYCRANPAYYPGSCNQVTFDPDKPTSLDMEFKLYESGEFLCKQVREFAGQ